METIISSTVTEVVIGGEHPTVLIGERINPSGKKALADSLKTGNLELVLQEALTQVQAGADIIDVNIGTFGVDEVTMLPKAVQAVMDVVDVPMCLDSTNTDALEGALKVCKGKPLINSVSGEKHSIERVLPLVKEYGTAVIGLLQDDEGIPKDSERRVSIAHKIVEQAGAVGISRENVIIDCMVFSVGADSSSGPAVIEAIRRIKSELGVNIILGVSNISFGLPDRDLLNNAFVAMAIVAGATCLIVDVAKVRSSVLAADLMLGRDKHARRYVEAYRQHQKAITK